MRERETGEREETEGERGRDRRKKRERKGKREREVTDVGIDNCNSFLYTNINEHKTKYPSSYTLFADKTKTPHAHTHTHTHTHTHKYLIVLFLSRMLARKISRTHDMTNTTKRAICLNVWTRVRSFPFLVLFVVILISCLLKRSPP